MGLQASAEVVVWARLSNSQSIGYSYMAISKRPKTTTLKASKIQSAPYCTILETANLKCCEGAKFQRHFIVESQLLLRISEITPCTLCCKCLCRSHFGLETRVIFKIESHPIPLRNTFLCQLFRALRQQWISAKIEVWHPWQLKKSKSWGPFQSCQLNSTYCQFSPFGIFFELNGLSWHCCVAGSSKTVPRILISSIAIGASYSYEVKNSEIWVPAFFKHNNSFKAPVINGIYSMNL